MDREVIKLSTQLKTMKVDKTEVETEFKAQVQKILMKRFCCKVHDFDWPVYA